MDRPAATKVEWCLVGAIIGVAIIAWRYFLPEVPHRR
jgi:Flp pilus assembly pilin Flp